MPYRLLLLLLLPAWATAAEFDIYQSDYRPLQLAWMVTGDSNDHAVQRLINQVVTSDLESSHSFAAMNSLSFLAGAEQAWAGVDYGDWRIIGTDLLALCHLSRTDGMLQAELKVHDPFRAKLLASKNLSAPVSGVRQLAHMIADHIYAAGTGIPGHFTSHILYVHKRGDLADLVYMDQDGANRQVLGRNFTLLLSPDWSPDNRKVALNTYVGNRPRLEIFELGSGKRHAFGAFTGLNSTPAWSPDGRFIAAALSRSGNTELHIYELRTRQWRQITHHPAIDTSPTWSPDGKWLAFTSDRDGTPQIYRIRLADGKVERVSLVGSYNTSPVWSPRGDRIAFITRKRWEFALATSRLDGSDIRYLVTGGHIESPAWSPNAQMLLFSREVRGTRRVFRIPSWGGEAEAITAANEDASDPAWSH